MMKYDIKTLEFESFKDFLLNNFISSFSTSSFKSINILHNVDDIYKRQNEIKQAVEFSKDVLELVEDDKEFFNLFYTLNDSTKSFDPVDFIVIKNFLVKIKQLKQLIDDKNYKYLSAYSESFASYDYLSDLIVQSIDDKGVIKDNATTALSEIRHGINQHKGSIRKILSGMFNSSNADKFIQEKVIVLRNGRYTIPCKTNFSQYIQGIIQDKSVSGQTLYIEPSSCVSENNAMQELIIAESAEIAKIIYSLISAIKASLIDLNKTVKLYSYLIMILELGIFYSNKEYTFGECSSNMEFSKIHHPLLYLRKGSGSIPIDFNVDKQGDIIVITGPNTGGKTAALKSIGLNHLISYCGLPVFGNYFKFMMFESIYADIGDNQSIIMDLSTFSSHMVNINNIITRSGNKSLVLFDELGTGTEPREGASLAVAILKNLVSKNATVIVTTHFTEVKNYALNSDNAYFYSVDFDYDNLSPRYKLIKGVMGKSDPIMIAERLGFSHDVISEAKNELLKYKSSLEMQVEELNKKEEILNSAKNELDKRLKTKEMELLEETYALLQKGKRLANQKIKLSDNEIDEAIKNTASKITEIKAKQEKIDDIKVNDIVFLDKYNSSEEDDKVKEDKFNLNIANLALKLYVSSEINKLLADSLMSGITKEMLPKKATQNDDVEKKIENIKIKKETDQLKVR